MADTIELEFTPEEIQNLSLDLSQIITWIESLNLGTAENLPINTDINTVNLRRFVGKIKNCLYHT